MSYHHGNLREALISAGLKLLQDKGAAGLTLRAAAKQAGVSPTAPQNHFGNLHGLQTAIAAEGYALLHDYMTDETAGDVSPRQRAFAGYVRFACENPGLFELMFSPHRTKSDDAELLAQAGRCYAVLAGLSAGLVWDKADAPDAVTRAEALHWSIVHGFAQLKVSGKLDKGALAGLEIADILPDFTYQT